MSYRGVDFLLEIKKGFRSAVPEHFLPATESGRVVQLSGDERGRANLGSSVVGLLDFAGNPRVNANGQINIGAYEK
jgi:hypothetical protein